jgi:4-diphosphocytidyl-2-C-methyl-D-erythritol kinase
MEVLACAKINLSLEVVGRRADGYHDLVGVMQSISLCDTLVFEKKPHNGVSLDTGCDLPADDSNLILRAAHAYFEKTKKPFGVDIRLTKRIPMKAGLGGGSADAAATLRAMNRLYGERLSEDELLTLAASIGSDVPYCLVGGTALCEGRGEKMTRIDSSAKGIFVVAIGNDTVSTPRAYAELDRLYSDFKNSSPKGRIQTEQMLKALSSGKISASNLYRSASQRK